MRTSSTVREEKLLPFACQRIYGMKVFFYGVRACVYGYPEADTQAFGNERLLGLADSKLPTSY